MSENQVPKREKTAFNLSALHIALISVACVLILAIATGSFLAVSYDKIYEGISVCGTPVGNMTAEDAMVTLEESLAEKSPAIQINFKGNQLSLDFKEFAEYDYESSANSAFDYGRNNFFTKLFTYVTPFVNRDIPAEFFLDEDKIAEFLYTEYSKLGDSYIDTSYEIKEDTLVITAGRSGNSLNSEEIVSQIREGIAKGNDVSVDAVVVHKDYEGIDIDAIYKEVAGKPENAYYDEDNGKIVPHKLGYDFDKEAAKTETENAAENAVFEIKLTIEYPEVTEAKLSGKMFEDVLASYTTKYNPGEVNRTHNMVLAGQKVNGTVLAPGQVFSYNGVVGERTVSKGYKNAKIFENGRVVDGLAGGICQVSTTIYNAALYSNMGIVERKNHSFPVAYAPMGQDATVVMGAIDFKFKNTMNNPVKITCSIQGGNCTVSILGIKEKNYKVQINNVITGSTPFGVEYQHDETMEIGEEKVIQKGSNGYTIKSTRTVYENGTVVKTESIPSSYYIPLKQIVARNESEMEEGTEINPEDETGSENGVQPEDGNNATLPPENGTETQPEGETGSENEVQPENGTEVQPEQPTSPELGLETEIYQ